MKIFVAVGTSHFDALVERMDAIAPGLPGGVTMQIGIGRVVPKNAPSFRFEPSLRDRIAEADLVVSHGGFGIMTEALSQGKRVVGVENSEMMDNHQRELLLKFSEEGYITWCRDLSGLEESILRAAGSNPKPYVLPESTMGARIREFLGVRATAARPAEIER
jgi:UDP-N-acetylglucosamine transferase subunit ALG13